MLRNPSDLNIDLIPVKEKGKRREDWRERNSAVNLSESFVQASESLSQGHRIRVLCPPGIRSASVSPP